ncbi:thiamine phosphate synthase [Luteimonas sp. YGD11-2]|uniref:thiamine phosphate synthase n=1 Tax=Luteimonas sp. YGD11-2 TaxID=2508168 RepID=UPI001F5154DB|nr:thiamine phosphate synthase [Luteimonas sp. YGD11-2]
MPASVPQRPCGLYLITPDDIDTARLLSRVESALPYACWLQYRNKLADASLRHEQAAALLVRARGHGVRLLINDDVALAARIGADGVHLGEGDGDLAQARALLGPEALVGASCYDDIARARRAVEAGADHVAFGAFHPSATKPGARRAHPDLLGQAAALGVPRVAIGGITPDNAGPLLDAGADLIAVVGGVFDAPDPVAAARAYRAAFDRARASS